MSLAGRSPVLPHPRKGLVDTIDKHAQQDDHVTQPFLPRVTKNEKHEGKTIFRISRNGQL
jgi:hypothetical protein